MTNAASSSDLPVLQALRLCRAVMPGVAGVVLSTPEGRVLASETPVSEPQELASRALRQREADGGVGASALVPRDGGLYLVVLLPATEAMAVAA